MLSIGGVLGVVWTVAAWWFLASVVAAPVFLLIRSSRARSKRLFVDEPTARVHALRPDTSHLHEMDAL